MNVGNFFKRLSSFLIGVSLFAQVVYLREIYLYFNRLQHYRRMSPDWAGEGLGTMTVLLMLFVVPVAVLALVLALVSIPKLRRKEISPLRILFYASGAAMPVVIALYLASHTK